MLTEGENRKKQTKKLNNINDLKLERYGYWLSLCFSLAFNLDFESDLIWDIRTLRPNARGKNIMRKWIERKKSSG